MEKRIPRRTFIGSTLLAAAALPGALNRVLAAGDAPAPMPVIDTHIHLYDPTRPQGVPWPNKNNSVLYKPSLPSRYKPIAEPLGIVGAIEIECSAWLEDNQWVLDVAEKNDIMVGTVGRLAPGTPDFRKQLDRFHANPLFRGIRVWLGGRQGGKDFDRPEFVADLKALADADLVMDTANPSVALLADVVRAGQMVPHLRIIVDHLPQMLPPTQPAQRASYDASMKELRGLPNVYVKVSEVLRNETATVPKTPEEPVHTDLEFYRPRLDEILDVFGLDRVLYGSDWPNGDQWRPVPVGFRIVQEYFNAKGRDAAEKYFWRNSVKCYKWVKRTAAQSRLA